MYLEMFHFEFSNDKDIFQVCFSCVILHKKHTSKTLLGKHISFPNTGSSKHYFNIFLMENDKKYDTPVFAGQS